MLVWGGGLIYTPQTSRAAPSSEFWKRKRPKTHSATASCLMWKSYRSEHFQKLFYQAIRVTAPLLPLTSTVCTKGLWRLVEKVLSRPQFHELSLQHCEKPLHQFPCSRNECSSSPLLLPAFALSTPTNGFAYGTRWERARSAGMHFATLSVHSSYHPHW